MSLPEIQRLNEIAQTLDELSDEGPTELSVLAEEMGALVDRLERHVTGMEESTIKREYNPEWLRQIEHIIQRQAEQILVDRYGRGGSNDPYFTINIPNPRARLLEDPLRFTNATFTASSPSFSVISGV